MYMPICEADEAAGDEFVQALQVWRLPTHPGCNKAVVQSSHLCTRGHVCVCVSRACVRVVV